ncbi:12162_t:CDS:2, partial [Funneliformis geosporum]
YIELMQACWDSNLNKRPIASNIYNLIKKIISNEEIIPTKIIKSQDIGPIIENKQNSNTITLTRLTDEYIKDNHKKFINNNYISKTIDFDI